MDEGLYGRPVILGYLVMRSIVGPVGASDPPRRPAPGAARGWHPAGRFGGPEAVVLREATRRAGVAPSAACRHFADRRALLDAICSAAQSALAVATEDELAGGGGLTHFQLLGVALDGLVETGVLPRGRRPGTEFLAWTAVHGLAMLLIDGPLRGLDPARADEVGRRLIDMVERGL